ncbi:PTS glucitol/sorbitol transporter subunit IIA [Fodinisporobacter ferrooxydans]|uniref:PTS glucitol/sorbitol transporter subunit IIA n=1 Tax=Fodinisporobacter ferrooxydans TaxID=2901836 RepID=A0ABY4CMJ8_9BACL|nr:PTS glucitol/sorbitol transporter subunit IIA [Alicyclobacillaceae bacterium MYW30-H2]
MKTSVVSSIGPMALAFEDEKVIILFGPKAPNELKDVSIIHETKEYDYQPLKVGTRLVLGTHEYTIEKIGTEAYNNLTELGHISVYFTDAPAEVLPGSIYVTPHIFPRLTPGDEIKFL